MVLGVAKGLHVRRESGLAIPQKGRSGDSAGGLRSMDSFSGKSDNPSFGRRPCLCGRNSNERQMKRTLFIAALMTAFNFTTMNGQNINEKTLEQRIEAIEDRMAIKNVVDTFSTLADTKEVELQGLLFTEDAQRPPRDREGLRRLPGHDRTDLPSERTADGDVGRRQGRGLFPAPSAVGCGRRGGVVLPLAVLWFATAALSACRRAAFGF